MLSISRRRTCPPQDLAVTVPSCVAWSNSDPTIEDLPQHSDDDLSDCDDSDSDFDPPDGNKDNYDSDDDLDEDEDDDNRKLHDVKRPKLGNQGGPQTPMACLGDTAAMRDHCWNNSWHLLNAAL